MRVGPRTIEAQLRRKFACRMMTTSEGISAALEEAVRLWKDAVGVDNVVTDAAALSARARATFASANRIAALV